MSCPAKHQPPFPEECKRRWVQLLGEIWDKIDYLLSAADGKRLPAAPLSAPKHRAIAPTLAAMGRMYKESYANTYAAMNVKSALANLINVLQPPHEKKLHTPRSGVCGGHKEHPHPKTTASTVTATNATVTAASSPRHTSAPASQSSASACKAPPCATPVSENQDRDAGDDEPGREDVAAVPLCGASEQSPSAAYEQKKDDDKNSVAFYSCKDELPAPAASPLRARLPFSPAALVPSHASNKDAASHLRRRLHHHHLPKKKSAALVNGAYPLVDGFAGAHIPPLMHDQIWRKSLRTCEGKLAELPPFRRGTKGTLGNTTTPTPMSRIRTAPSRQPR